MSPTDYRVWYSHSATKFLFALPPRDQWRLWTHVNELAKRPFLRRGYRLVDPDGHEIEHHIADPWLISYWIDHAQRAVMVVEVETKDQCGRNRKLPMAGLELMVARQKPFGTKLSPAV